MPPDPELLHRIIAEGDRRRRRRRAVTGGGAAAVVLLAGVVLWSGGDDGDPDHVDVAAGDDDPTTTTTKSDRTTSTVAPTSTSTSITPAGDDSTDPPPETPPDTSADPVDPCRNSVDPACGDTYWDYDPATFPNAPTVISVPPAPVVAVAGQPTAITFVVSDEDAHFSCGAADYEGAASVSYGWAGFENGWTWNVCHVTGCGMGGDRTMRYGPWDPPPPPDGAGTPVEPQNVVVWDEPGNYDVTVRFDTANRCFADNPVNPDQEVFTGYDSSAEVTFTVEVIASEGPEG